MSDYLQGLKRTDMCGTLRATDIGRDVVVMGWAVRRRDLGNLVFVQLRDKTGVVQIVFDKTTTDAELFENLAAQHAGGRVQARLAGTGFRSDHREKDTGVRVVGRDFAAGDRHKTHARIPHFERNDLGKVPGDLLGDTLESHFRRALTISGGDFSIFVKSPVCLIFLLISLALIVYTIAKPMIEKKRKKAQ